MDNLVISVDTAADYTAAANRGLVVQWSDSNEVTLATGSNAQICGILVEATSATRAKVCISGKCLARVGATFTHGTTAAFVTAGADSRIDPAATTEYYVGRLAGGSTNDLADADWAFVMVQPGQLD